MLGILGQRQLHYPPGLLEATTYQIETKPAFPTYLPTWPMPPGGYWRFASPRAAVMVLCQWIAP